MGQVLKIKMFERYVNFEFYKTYGGTKNEKLCLRDM